MHPTDDSGDTSGTAPDGRPRRWFLAGGVAAVVGGGLGVTAGFGPHEQGTPPPTPPAALLAALTAERDLLALGVAAVARDPSLRTMVAALTRDHRAHARALTTLLSTYPKPAAPLMPATSGPTSSSTSTPTGTPTGTPDSTPTRLALRTAERQAAAAAATRAASMTGATAVLLASISACEATHAELLS